LRIILIASMMMACHHAGSILCTEMPERVKLR
jgi:hypothetical protein